MRLYVQTDTRDGTGQKAKILMGRPPVTNPRAREVAEKLVELYATEAVAKAREMEKISSVLEFAKDVTKEVERILKLS